MTEIPGNARVAAADALIAAGFVDPDDGTVPRWHATEPAPVWTNPMQVVDVVLAAALPHLRVQETQARDLIGGGIRSQDIAVEFDDEERGFVEVALQAVDAGNAGHWPTVAGYLADEVRRLRTTPAPRPVVDREALIRTFLETFEAGGLWDGLEPEAYKVRWRTKWATTFADAALALLPTEEDTKGEGS